MGRVKWTSSSGRNKLWVLAPSRHVADNWARDEGIDPTWICYMYITTKVYKRDWLFYEHPRAKTHAKYKWLIQIATTKMMRASVADLNLYRDWSNGNNVS